jgi:hypothetical protein
MRFGFSRKGRDKIMKKLTFISQFVLVVLLGVGAAQAQNFVDPESTWRTDLMKASGKDTIRIERRSMVALSEVCDTTALVYHEPLPDNLMPKATIEIGKITIQAESADEVVEVLEEKARELGADWIVGFNEPRLSHIKGYGFFYRSSATLYKVVEEELIAIEDIGAISPLNERMKDLASVMTWLDNYVVREEE